MSTSSPETGNSRFKNLNYLYDLNDLIILREIITKRKPLSFFHINQDLQYIRDLSKVIEPKFRGANSLEEVIEIGGNSQKLTDLIFKYIIVTNQQNNLREVYNEPIVLNKFGKDNYDKFVIMFQRWYYDIPGEQKKTITTELILNKFTTLDELFKYNKKIGEIFTPAVLTFFYAYKNKNLPKDEVYETIEDYLSDKTGSLPYTNIDTFYKAYNSWYNVQLKELNTQLQALLFQSQSYSKIQDLATYYNITVKETGFYLKIPNPTNTDKLSDIFLKCNSSYDVPYIRYLNNEGIPRFKIFKGNREELTPSYKVAIPENVPEEKNTIKLYVWKQQYSNKIFKTLKRIQEANKVDFVFVTISLIKNYILVECKPVLYVEDVIARVTKTLKSYLINYDFKKNIIKNNYIIEGNFVINRPLNNLPLQTIYLAILLDPIASSFFTLEESSKSSKTWIKLKHFPVKAEAEYINEPIGKTIKPGITLTDQQSVIKLRIEGRTESNVRTFIKIFTRIIQYISKIRNPILNTMSEFSVDLDFNNLFYFERTLDENFNYLSDKFEGVKESGSNQGIKIRLLKQIAPEIFVSGYARICQKPTQPIPVSDKEAEIWNKKKGHQIVKFPLPEQIKPGYSITPNYYVCPTRQLPFIRMKKAPDSSAAYEIPCCSSSYAKPSAAAVGRRMTSGKTSLTTFKIADRKKRGDLKIPITNFELFREGTYFSPNSMIHCLNEIFNPNVMVTERSAEYEARRIRMQLKTMKNVMSQELFGYPESEINQILDSCDFLDPYLWYRGLEEIFNCNIYVFQRKSSNRDSNTTIPKLMIPRFKYFHVHKHNKRLPTIIILRHYGAEKDHLEIPQCELVVVNNQYKIMNGELDNLAYKLYTIMNYIAGVNSWDSRDSNLVARENIFFKIKPEMFGVPFDPLHKLPLKTITRQYIDSVGKLRIIEIAIEKNESGDDFSDKRLYVITLPTYPLNIPVFKINDIPHDNFITYDQVVELFGENGKFAVSKDVQGLWYDMGDIENAIFVPCSRTEGIEPVTNIVPSFLHREKESIINTISNLKRTAKILMHLICYLCLKYTNSDHGLIPQFVKSQFYDDFKPEPNYNLMKVPRILPNGTYQSVYRNLKKITENFLTDDGKIIIQSERIKQAAIQVCEKLIISQETANDYRMIRNYFMTSLDFSNNLDMEYVLSGHMEYTNWRNYIRTKDNYYLTTIVDNSKNYELDLKSFQTPRIYKEGDRFFLIQNCGTKSANECVYLGKIWLRSRINLGYNVIVPKEKLPEITKIDYSIYEINQSGNLKLIHEADEIKLLKYKDNTYAALLELNN